MSMAVGLLLQARMPKWQVAERVRRRRHSEFLRGRSVAERNDALWELIQEEADMDADEFAKFGKIVLAISRHLGLLHSADDPQYQFPGGYVRAEPLTNWIDLAVDIQLMFFGREAQKRLQQDVERAFGRFRLHLSYTSSGPAVSIRPDDMRSALVYHASQMIAKGTALQTCRNCKEPFLGGGHSHNGNKKRADARFCSERCRWTYHNEVRRKTKARR
jgi:hypothetical protein